MRATLLRTLGALAVLALVLTSAKADPVQGTIYFTTYNPVNSNGYIQGSANGGFDGGPNGRNVHKVNFNYNGTTFTLGTPTPISLTNGADGIIFAPNGNLLVGGQNSGLVHQVNPVTGTYTSQTTGQGGAFHLTLDPSGTKVWSAGLPGVLSDTPLAPFAPGTAHLLNGNDTTITHVAFDGAGNAYYINDTGNGADGNGNLGTINLGTFTTTRVHSLLDGAHGMAYDPFSGDLMVFGHDRILQVDVPSLTVVANLQFPGLSTFDQGTVDGKGHLFVASNAGPLLFMDYSSDGVISLSHYSATPFLANYLDDIAPLAGLGSQPVPLPGVLAAFPILAGITALTRRTRRQVTH
jgi:hypothetical protein